LRSSSEWLLSKKLLSPEVDPTGVSLTTELSEEAA
jgi:hypothetical protein